MNTLDNTDMEILNIVMEKGVPLNIWLREKVGKMEQEEMENLC